MIQRSEFMLMFTTVNGLIALYSTAISVTVLSYKLDQQFNFVAVY